jgi:hypothetical protein
VTLLAICTAGWVVRPDSPARAESGSRSPVGESIGWPDLPDAAERSRLLSEVGPFPSPREITLGRRGFDDDLVRRTWPEDHPLRSRGPPLWVPRIAALIRSTFEPGEAIVTLREIEGARVT